MHRLTALPLYAVIALTTAACGGGGDNDNTEAPQAKGLFPDCQAVARLGFPNTNIKSSTAVDAGAVKSGTTALPGHCVVTGEINPRIGVNGVRYGTNFELRLPSEWNGRFNFQGGGGTDGNVPAAFGPELGDALPALAQGFAVVTSDMGHAATDGRDASFGLDPQARIDWGYNSLDQVTVLAKEIITQYYGKPADKSYFVGCSGGGRQALMMSQRFPTYFDGIVAGAPILEQHVAQIGATMLALQEYTAIAPKNADGKPILSKAVSDSDLKLISRAVLDKCDALDGLKDGVIDNYPACSFEAKSLQCTGEKTDSCLSPAQANAIDKVMAGPRDSKGTLLYPAPPWDSWTEGWRGTMFGTSLTEVPNATKSTNTSIRYVFMTPPDPTFDYLKFNFDTDPAKMAGSAAFTATTSTNYSTFKARGAKAIIYTGISDPLVNPAGVYRWYQNLAAANGGVEATRDFARFFYAPGMGHCRGGNGLDTFDRLMTLVDWVEKGKAPDALIAKGAAFPGRSRPICAFPNQTRYKGEGSIEDAANFVCEPPKPV